MTALKMLVWVYEQGKIEHAKLDMLEQALGTYKSTSLAHLLLRMSFQNAK